MSLHKAGGTAHDRIGRDAKKVFIFWLPLFTSCLHNYVETCHICRCQKIRHRQSYIGLTNQFFLFICSGKFYVVLWGEGILYSEIVFCVPWWWFLNQKDLRRRWKWFMSVDIFTLKFSEIERGHAPVGSAPLSVGVIDMQCHNRARLDTCDRDVCVLYICVPARTCTYTCIPCSVSKCALWFRLHTQSVSVFHWHQLGHCKRCLYRLSCWLFCCHRRVHFLGPHTWGTLYFRRVTSHSYEHMLPKNTLCFILRSKNIENKPLYVVWKLTVNLKKVRNISLVKAQLNSTAVAEVLPKCFTTNTKMKFTQHKIEKI